MKIAVANRFTLLSLFALWIGALHAEEPRTFTDQFGRTIKAEVISVDANTAKVKREDGQVFDLPIEKLSEEDQAWLKNWKSPSASEAKPKVFTPVPGSVTISASRGKFDSDTAYQSAYSKATYEEWGFSVQLTNTTLYPIENLRMEYRIYGRLHGGSQQREQRGVKAIETLGARKSAVFRTKTFRVYRFRSNSGAYTYKGGLDGIWARLYCGDVLLGEYASPENLITEQTWDSAPDTHFQ